MNKDLIVIEQLPVIVTKLKGISKDIKAKVDEALSLVCTEDTVKTVKAYRAELNKDKAEIEALRKEIKAKVLAPYEEFEEIYKKNITDIYAEADKQLKEKIDSVENEIKAEKESKLRAYFEELKQAEKIDFIVFEDAHINITLSASEKSLKDAAWAFVNRVADELRIIESQDFKDEILYEYKKSLRLSEAIITVTERHRELDKKETVSETEIVEQAEEVKTEEADKPLTAPTVIDEKEYPMTFTVKATRAKLKKIKEFLEKEGIYYE